MPIYSVNSISRWPAMSAEPVTPLRVLFTRLQNIGDALNAVPALRSLRQALPHARITLLAKHAGGVEVMRNCPYIDDMIVVRSRSLAEKIRLIREFRRRKLDYFIISPQDLGRVPWAWLGGARVIVGYPRIVNYGRTVREKLPFLLRIAPKFDPNRTEVDHCLKLVEDVLDDLGVPLPQQSSRALEYSWQTAEDVAAATAALGRAGIGEGAPFVASAPFSKRPAKNWPVERYAAVFKRVSGDGSVPVVLLGGQDERARTVELARRAGPFCRTSAGETSIASSAVIIKRASLFVGPDSGPAFIATAVGTPAVVLYGPADYYRWRVADSSVPRTELVHPISCSPCREQECTVSPSCMELISEDEVAEACGKLWRAGS